MLHSTVKAAKSQLGYIHALAIPEHTESTPILTLCEPSAPQHPNSAPTNAPATPEDNLLPFDTLQKMLQRFLSENKLKKSALAYILNLSEQAIDELIAGNKPNKYLQFARVIDLTLIKIYCKTKWNT